jgi:O-antigen ligase
MRGILAKFSTRQPVDLIMVLLVILFPVLSLSVRHWVSGIYSLLCVISIFLLARQRRFDTRDKIIISFIIAYLTVFALSATVNGWTPTSVHAIGAQLKFLLFIPFYLYLRNHKIPLQWFYYALAAAGVVLGTQSLIDIYFLDYRQGWGIYGPIIFGDFSALVASFLLVLLKHNKNIFSKQEAFYAVGMLMAIIATIISGSRNAWLALIVVFTLVFVFDFLRSRDPYKFVKFTVFIGTALLAAILFTPDKILERKDKAFNEYWAYFQGEKVTKEDSVGFRLEQWKAAIYAFTKKPVIGHGPGNTGIAVNEVVEEGKADRVIYKDNAKVNIVHVHNGYFEVLVSQGLIGLTVLLSFFVYLYWFFLANWRVDSVLSSLGLVHITGFLIFFLTEIPFIHDNFISIYLLFLGVFYSELQKRSDASESAPEVGVHVAENV